MLGGHWLGVNFVGFARDLRGGYATTVVAESDGDEDMPDGVGDSRRPHGGFRLGNAGDLAPQLWRMTQRWLTRRRSLCL